MWEAVALPGEREDVLAWVTDDVVPDALATDGCLGAEGFVGLGDDECRVVVITRWKDDHAEDWDEGAPHRELLRSGHAWYFQPL
jgi:hypothetical protein